MKEKEKLLGSEHILRKCYVKDVGIKTLAMISSHINNNYCLFSRLSVSYEYDDIESPKTSGIKINSRFEYFCTYF